MKKKPISKKTSRKAPRKRSASPVGDIAEDLRALAEPLDGLVPDPGNARTHDEANLAAIAASLQRYGQRRPVVVNRTGRVIEAGHGLVEAAKRLGWSHVAVLWVKDDPAAATGYSLADNRTAELAAWNDERLLAALSTVDDADPDLAAALLLDKLLAESPATTQGAAEQPVPEIWEVVIVCEDEADQKALYERMQAEGRKCRLMTV